MTSLPSGAPPTDGMYMAPPGSAQPFCMSRTCSIVRLGSMEAFGDALRAMCELGRVREGDRTLIDALAPADAQLSTHRDAPVAESCEAAALAAAAGARSEEHTSELQSRENLVCRLLLEKKKQKPQKRA